MTDTLLLPDQALGAGMREVRIPAGGVGLRGTLAWPVHPSGLVILARSGGAGPPERRLAGQLRAEGMSTLLLDLLPGDGESEAAAIRTAERCVGRLAIAAAWAAAQPEVAGLPLGYLGVGKLAAAPLAGADTSPLPVQAVVVAFGRPDLLGDRLAAIQVPTLFITGSRDEEGFRAHRAALARLGGPRHLTILPGTGPGSDTPAASEELGRCAASWFVHYLAMEPAWRRGMRSSRWGRRA